MQDHLVRLMAWEGPGRGCCAVQVEGRPVSDSEEEEPDETAEEAAVLAAELDGAQVERIDSGRNAGGEPSTYENFLPVLV